MPALLRLEDFDLPRATPADDGPPPPSPEYLAGHAAGLADAAAAQAAQQAGLTEAALRLLNDLAFTHAEARGHVMAALRPLFAAIASRLLPEMAHVVLGAHLAEGLGRAAAAASEVPLVLHLHPDTASRLAPLLDEVEGLRLVLRPDPGLDPLQARWATGDGETELDLDALVNEIRTVLAAIHPPSEGETADERPAQASAQGQP
ncbi:MAG: hypothetical protein GC146_09035 [Limimaricola sp.]|uniref:hypothetical protein n=1 Tax=Limimaricola sp. TaxID=2211665 RepID=UPI001D690388|nr:hypothetical protein [Limimaricola sp.]MBI1417353.1 hypothetical protein [Limimaricola sp.]